MNGLGGEYLEGVSSNHPEITIPEVIIYTHKYENLSIGANYEKPYYRAFVTTSGQIKITDSTNSGINAKYKGWNGNRPIPNLNEADWLAAGIAGLDKPANDLAANYAALPPEYKWDVFDFGLDFAVTAETANSITLAWPALSGVSGYNI